MLVDLIISCHHQVVPFNKCVENVFYFLLLLISFQTVWWICCAGYSFPFNKKQMGNGHIKLQKLQKKHHKSFIKKSIWLTQLYSKSSEATQ